MGGSQDPDVVEERGEIAGGQFAAGQVVALQVCGSIRGP